MHRIVKEGYNLLTSATHIMLMMNVTKKPVHIQTTNKWANRKTDVDGELEVELDRLTIRDDKERTRKNQSVSVQL